MQDIDTQELILKIIEQAQEGIQKEFHLITTWPEYRFYQDQEASFDAVIKVLRNCANSVFKEYLKAVAVGEAPFVKLLAYKQFQDIITYYKHEQHTIQEMLIEYHDYLAAGNFFRAFLGEVREG
jgi:hypothetical protein